MSDTSTIVIRHRGSIKTIQNVLGAAKAEKNGQQGLAVVTETNGAEFYPDARLTGVGDQDFPDEYNLIA